MRGGNAVVALAVVAGALGVGDARGQEVRGPAGCGGRAELRIRVVDSSGVIPLPGADVYVRWVGVRPDSLTHQADDDGSLAACMPPGATGAVARAEFANGSSLDAEPKFEPGLPSDVELRVLPPQVRVVRRSATPPPNTGRIVGQVRDALTGLPVAGATVSITGQSERTETGMDGRFVLSRVPEGQRELRVGQLGYSPYRYFTRIVGGRIASSDVELEPAPIEVEPIVATAEYEHRLEVSGFYERKAWGERVGTGTFFTAEDVVRRRPNRLTDLVADARGMELKCYARGCMVVNRRYNGDEIARRGPRPGRPPLLPTYCPRGAAVFVDGIEILYHPMDSVVLPPQVAGVEVYSSSTVPIKFQVLAPLYEGCGVVAIWTK